MDNVESPGSLAMDKTEQLLVRACKSRNPYPRLYSVYRRFYCGSRAKADFHLASILTRLCDRYLEISLSRIISDLNPQNRCLFGMSQDTDYWTSTLRVLISYIATAEASRFPGLTPPAMFRHAMVEAGSGRENGRRVQ